MLQYFIDAFAKNYVNFSGRARRKEFWSFTLFNWLMYVITIFLGIIVTNDGDAALIPFFVYLLASLLPMLAVACRRLHDIGKSGTMYLVRFVPLIGGIWLLVLYCTDGDSGPNNYGEDPKRQNYSEFDQIGRPEVF